MILTIFEFKFDGDATARTSAYGRLMTKTLEVQAKQLLTARSTKARKVTVTLQALRKICSYLKGY